MKIYFNVGENFSDIVTNVRKVFANGEVVVVHTENDDFVKDANFLPWLRNKKGEIIPRKLNKANPNLLAAFLIGEYAAKLYTLHTNNALVEVTG